MKKNQNKKNTLLQITNHFKKKFKLKSLYLYGGFLSKNSCIESDIDLIVIFKKNPTIQEIKKLKKTKIEFLKKGMKLDISIHSDIDMPHKRGKLFWHNNRGAYMTKEMVLYGKLLLGEKVFTKDNFFSLDEMKIEAVKVVNSLKYNLIKTVILELDEKTKKKRILKFALNGVPYGLAFYNIFPKRKNDYFLIFKKKFKTKVNVYDLLKYKKNSYGSDVPTNLLIKKSYQFISEIDKNIFTKIQKEKAFDYLKVKHHLKKNQCLTVPEIR